MGKQLVRQFYERIWDAHNTAAIPDILHEDFSFRGSLGQELRGHDGFAGYVDMVHAGLDEYRCIIQELVEESDKVFAKMLFTGVHRATLMGYPPTNKRVSWHGAALFTILGERISEVWVLGDLKSLEAQLGPERSESSDG